MEHIRQLFTVVGALTILVGIAWVAHGTGAFHLPGTDFMPNESVWTINGMLVAVFGLIVFIGARWFLRREHKTAN
ncbi:MULTISPECIES: hypothetical protein [Alphaproteobacteria]|uniref:Uncharacterized protein n=2 Tax=Alphaproteobacteria TaxID=28211 RepID=A0A512HG44_9HYPH|nr:MULTISPECIES: hypothetical protein [Alphaproteobacteria]GEO84418.1 hypothetical protein RNA01_13500 [Ciceribacter naphthalenivorans]GLR22381.1 hypothetical protein GCM10007920_21680 [Ciceribacter naphthalenivorans]GLT05237.1 hypothetical protein GCM10007926_21680 [Sphingomonas psychrolutea]